MKVKYIGENGSELSVLKGKVYECLGKEKTWYRVVDETNEDYLYPIEDFEVVEKNDLQEFIDDSVDLGKEPLQIEDEELKKAYEEIVKKHRNKK